MEKVECRWSQPCARTREAAAGTSEMPQLSALRDSAQALLPSPALCLCWEEKPEKFAPESVVQGSEKDERKECGREAAGLHRP